MLTLLATRLYSLLAFLIVWGGLAPAHAIAVACGRGRLAHVWERLGGGRFPAPGRSPRLVVHGVSAGEMRTAGILVGHLARHMPSCSIILTTGTPCGRQVAKDLAVRHPQVERVTYLPWDCRGAVTRWLGRLDPDAVVTLEAELWPNLFLAAARRQIPLFVVNGRLRAGDARRYAHAGRFFSDVLAAATWIGVQDAEAFEAYRLAGAPRERLSVTGNMKIDREAPPAAEYPWLTAPGDAPLIVCGSTHAPEERWLVAAFERVLQDVPTARLVLAPRRPARARQIGREAARRGLRPAFWSAGETTADWRVLVVDTMGPLASLYAHASVVVAGGTFAPRGGHNIIEAARCARAIVVGPHVANIQTIVSELDARGGIRGVSEMGVEALASTLSTLLAAPEVRARLGQAAALYCREQMGATERSAQVIADHLRARRRRVA